MASARRRLRFHCSLRRPAAALLCAASLAAGCTAHHSQPKAPATKTTTLARRYLAIAVPANRQLDDEVDSYADHEHDNLPIAEAELRKEIATERRFDQQLLKIPFPTPLAAIATALVGANNQRIALTTRQARAATLAELVAFDQRHKGADAAVEVQVRSIRKALGLPPPDTS